MSHANAKTESLEDSLAHAEEAAKSAAAAVAEATAASSTPAADDGLLASLKEQITVLQSELARSAGDLADSKGALSDVNEAFAAQMEAVQKMAELESATKIEDAQNTANQVRKDLDRVKVENAELKAQLFQSEQVRLHGQAPPTPSKNGAGEKGVAELHAAHEAKLSQVSGELKGEIEQLRTELESAHRELDLYRSE